jgi:hypothetical protein
MKNFIGLMTVMMLGVLVSCSLSEEASVGVDLDSETSIDSFFEDVDVIADAGIDATSSNGGRIARGRDSVLECATITHDSVEHIITIDFGDGCEGPGGKVRSGQIIITYSGKRNETGSTRSVTFNDFVIDSVQLEGTRSITNISSQGNDLFTFNVTLTDGKITFGDGTMVTREATHTRSWYRGSSVAEDYATLVGESSGVNREGISYSTSISEELVFVRSCVGTAFIPVSGVKAITIGEEEIVIDFGDGTCDNIVSVTKDGVTTEEELEYNPYNPKRRIIGR